MDDFRKLFYNGKNLSDLEKAIIKIRMLKNELKFIDKLIEMTREKTLLALKLKYKFPFIRTQLVKFEFMKYQQQREKNKSQAGTTN